MAAAVVNPSDKLERVKLHKPTKAMISLATQSKRLLGYEALFEHVLQPGQLGKAIMKLDITILSKESIAAYKLDMLRIAKRKHRSTNRVRYRVAWKTTPISSYTAPIPEFVLHKAVQVAKLVPDAAFTVDHLNVRRTRVQRVPAQRRDWDPFLHVSHGTGNKREEYYIEVWGEPKFEDKL